MSNHSSNSSLSTGRAENIIRHVAQRLRHKSSPEIDFTTFTHFDIGALVNIIAFAFAARFGGIPTLGLVPPFAMKLPESSTARAFLTKMKLFDFVHRNQGMLQGGVIDRAILWAHQENENQSKFANESEPYPFMPFRLVVRKFSDYANSAVFESECRHFLESLYETFDWALKEHLHLEYRDETDDDNSEADFYDANKETVKNIYMHSGSWGIGVIQAYKDSVIIAYGDIGKGMASSLSKRRTDIENKIGGTWGDCMAIRGAFLRGMTSLPGKSRGLGLYEIKEYTLARGGDIECRSGSGKVVFSSKKAQPYEANVEYIPGVQIRIWLPAQRAARA